MIRLPWTKKKEELKEKEEVKEPQQYYVLEDGYGYWGTAGSTISSSVTTTHTVPWGTTTIIHASGIMGETYELQLLIKQLKIPRELMVFE